MAGEPGSPAAGEVGEALHVAAEVAVGVPPRRNAVQVVLAQVSRAASSAHTGAAPAICSSRGRGWASYPTGWTPRRSARRGHIHRHWKTSPLATLKAVSAAAGVTAAQCICSASNPASVMSATPFHWVSTPGTRRALLLATYGGLCGERLAHIHRVAQGVADDRVGPVDAPGEVVRSAAAKSSSSCA